MGEGDLVLAWLKVCLVFFTLVTLPVSATAAIGKVLRVTQGAEITRAGKTTRVREGMEVASGDTISTNATGIVQLTFVDETKIAVGPNAQMVLDVSMLRGGRKAKNFTVKALGGSFRFISGKSRKRAYSIQTPTATMAVRGTTFDMWITSGNQSAMIVIEGTVRMCGTGGSCRSASRQCSFFATSSGGQVGRPADREQYDKALKGGFPFLRSQGRLLPAFQVDAEGCSGDSTAAAAPPRIKSDAPEVRTARRDQPAAQRTQPAASRAAAKPAQQEPEERTEAKSEADAESRARARSSAGELSVSAGSPSERSQGEGDGARATATAGDVTAEAGW